MKRIDALGAGRTPPTDCRVHQPIVRVIDRHVCIRGLLRFLGTRWQNNHVMSNRGRRRREKRAPRSNSEKRQQTSIPAMMKQLIDIAKQNY